MRYITEPQQIDSQYSCLLVVVVAIVVATGITMVVAMLLLFIFLSWERKVALVRKEATAFLIVGEKGSSS